MKKDTHRHERAKKLMSQAGYAKGGAIKKDVKSGVRQHEDSLHKGQPKTKIKLKDGGYVDGGAPKKRVDKPTRSAIPVQMKDGGKAKKKGKDKTQVNVIIAGDKEKPMPPLAPMAGASMAAPAMPPVGGPPMLPPPGMKKGGVVKKMTKYPIDAGSGSGLGRLQKSESLKKKGIKPKN